MKTCGVYYLIYIAGLIVSIIVAYFLWPYLGTLTWLINFIIGLLTGYAGSKYKDNDYG